MTGRLRIRRYPCGLMVETVCKLVAIREGGCLEVDFVVCFLRRRGVSSEPGAASKVDQFAYFLALFSCRLFFLLSLLWSKCARINPLTQNALVQMMILVRPLRQH